MLGGEEKKRSFIHLSVMLMDQKFIVALFFFFWRWMYVLVQVKCIRGTRTHMYLTVKKKLYHDDSNTFHHCYYQYYYFHRVVRVP